MDCCFEASSLHFGRRHLSFLEPEVTIFGRQGGAELARYLTSLVSKLHPEFPLTMMSIRMLILANGKQA